MTEGATDRPSVACELLRETEKAWYLDTGDKEIWFPKSQGELYKQADGSYELFGEAWIMKEKGLI
jgi:hypothetical protein